RGTRRGGSPRDLRAGSDCDRGYRVHGRPAVARLDCPQSLQAACLFGHARGFRLAGDPAAAVEQWRTDHLPVAVQALPAFGATAVRAARDPAANALPPEPVDRKRRGADADGAATFRRAGPADYVTGHGAVLPALR